MNSVFIGIASGLLTILFIALAFRKNKPTVYGLVLSGIGFLYVGFTWTDTPLFIINSLQAISFVFIAYYGILRSSYVLAAGYFLHGTWDLVYDFFATPDLLPPHYDLFCMSLDFTIGCYLVITTCRKIKVTK